ncbi:MAG TPA: glycosyltransferase family 4 protein [Methylomirabilota bacterium]
MIRQIVSCRGWSSDAYWAARAAVELERAGHDVTLVCKRRSEARVIRRARAAGVTRIETLELASGVKPIADSTDLHRIVRWLPDTRVLHVHRGKEHWLAALAIRLAGVRRPLVRTRHIVQPVRPHALNRWLYNQATDLVVTVTEAIRLQLLAAGLGRAERVVAVPGGVDAERFGAGTPRSATGGLRAALPDVPPDTPLVGLVSGFRAMKGHQTVVEAATRLAHGGHCFHLVLIGQGALLERVRDLVGRAGLPGHTSILGFVDDLPAVMSALDVGIYSALESDGMSRVLFEYLATGVPVVATRVGVVPEILADDRTALLVPAGEPEPMAAAIGRLLRDRVLRHELGGAGAALVRARYSGQRVAERLTGLYRTLGAASVASHA